MDEAARDYFPPGDIRVSDAERDRALSELSEALQAGRITAEEFDERSGQALGARTGKELAAPLADLPLNRSFATLEPPTREPATREPATRTPAARTTALERPHPFRAPGAALAAAAGAACFGASAVLIALSSGPSLAQREYAQEVLARQGISIPLPPAQGMDWAGAIRPGIIAVMFVMLVIYLRVSRPRRA
jgi:hypothetical protein